MRGSVKRRRFLEAGIVAAGGSLVSCGRTGGGPYWRFFTAAEARCANAICEQIIPADDFPGASQAGVVNFLDVQLTRHYRKHRDAYRQGLAGVDEAARKRSGKPFAELAPEQQTEILTGADREVLIGTPVKRYFADPARAEDAIARTLADVQTFVRAAIDRSALKG